jgi:hypothetical protein
VSLLKSTIVNRSLSLVQDLESYLRGLRPGLAEVRPVLDAGADLERYLRGLRPGLAEVRPVLDAGADRRIDLERYIDRGLDLERYIDRGLDLELERLLLL